MSNYGEILDDFNPLKDYIYSLFVNYFSNPTLTKIKNDTDFSMYAVKFFCLLKGFCVRTHSLAREMRKLRNACFARS